MEFTSNISDLDLPISFLKADRREKNEWFGNEWFKTITDEVDNNSENHNRLFDDLISQISKKEYIFLKSSFLEMSMLVDQLSLEMKKIQSVVELKVNKLKKKLKSHQEFFSKIDVLSETSFNLEATQTADEILAIQYQINNLHQYKGYNILSDRLFRAKMIPVDALDEGEIANLIGLGLLQEIKLPLGLYKADHVGDKSTPVNPDNTLKQSRYCYSPLGQAFLKASESKK